MEYQVTLQNKMTIIADTLEEAREDALHLAQISTPPMSVGDIDLVGPLPVEWKCGMRVMYLRDQEWGPSKGSIGVIERRREEDYGKPANQYQVFWVVPERGSGIFWTTPEDVVLVP